MMRYRPVKAISRPSVVLSAVRSRLTVVHVNVMNGQILDHSDVTLLKTIIRQAQDVLDEGIRTEKKSGVTAIDLSDKFGVGVHKIHKVLKS